MFCPTAKVRPPPLEGSGRVFACDLGESGTVKFAIHELGRTARVENIKIMWNDSLVEWDAAYTLTVLKRSYW
jgi:hypothetical protein